MLVVTFGYFIAKDQGFIGQQMTQPTGQVVQPAVQGYVPFALASLDVYLYDNANKNSLVTETSVKGYVYPAGTSDADIANPITPIVDSATVSSGKLSFTARKVQTGTSYRIKITDTSATPVWYGKVVDVNVPQLSAALGASATWTAPNVYLDKIGTFATFSSAACTGAGGAPLPNGASYSSGVLTLNKAVLGSTGINTYRCEIQIANVAPGTVLKDVVIHPQADPSAPLPTTSFMSASLGYVTGTNYNLPSDILSFVTSGAPIRVGDVTASQDGKYYLQFTIDQTQYQVGSFYFYLDDLGKYLGQSSVDNGYGAQPKSLKIQVISS
jgi:hypothetical protein